MTRLGVWIAVFVVLGWCVIAVVLAAKERKERQEEAAWNQE